MANKHEFDQHAENYNAILAEQLNFFAQDSAYFAEYKILELKSLLTVAPRRILDFGCGIGRSVTFLRQYFPGSEIFGGDVSEESLALARTNCPEAAYFVLDDDWSQRHKFDLIFASNVFHHIRPADRQKTMRSLAQACEPGGRLVVFEHNPLNPLTRYLVNTCPFDRDAVLLRPSELKNLFRQAGCQHIERKYTLFFPSALKRWRFLEKYLGFLPLGGQYLVSGVL